MRHLIGRDLRLLAPYAWLIAPGHVLWCAQAFLTPELYFWMSLAAALGWTVAILAIEWSLDTDRFVASLPVTRATIVRARYASALGGLALGALLYNLYGRALMAVASGERLERWHDSPVFASADGIAAFLVVGYVLVVGFLPFHFRLGLPLGATLFSASAGVVAFATVAVARPTGPAGHAAAVSSVASAGGSVSEVIRGWFSLMFDAWGSGVAAAMLFAAAVALGLVSVRLAVRFYEGRDL